MPATCTSRLACRRCPCSSVPPSRTRPSTAPACQHAHLLQTTVADRDSSFSELRASHTLQGVCLSQAHATIDSLTSELSSQRDATVSLNSTVHDLSRWDAVLEAAKRRAEHERDEALDRVQRGEVAAARARVEGAQRQEALNRIIIAMQQESDHIRWTTTEAMTTPFKAAGEERERRTASPTLSLLGGAATMNGGRGDNNAAAENGRRPEAEPTRETGTPAASGQQELVHDEGQGAKVDELLKVEGGTAEVVEEVTNNGGGNTQAAGGEEGAAETSAADEEGAAETSAVSNISGEDYTNHNDNCLATDPAITFNTSADMGAAAGDKKKKKKK